MYRKLPLSERGGWYASVTEAYYRVRPRCPPAMLDEALHKAHLAPPARLLEIGCGPGNITVDLAARDFGVLGIEPNTQACDVARQHCGSEVVTFESTTFEEWRPNGVVFDAVVAASSFHWLNPDVAYPKVVSVLKQGGHLILLWNTDPKPSKDVWNRLSPHLSAVEPKLAEYVSVEQHAAAVAEIADGLLQSGLFTDLQTASSVQELQYSKPDYLALLTTLSPYIALDASVREDLLNRLASELPNELVLENIAIYQVLRKQA